MKKALIVMLVGAFLLIPTVQAHASWRHKMCRFQSLEKGNWTVKEVQLTIRCAVDHFPTSLSTANYVADRESNFRWYATNSYSGACGIYQHLPQYWPSRVSTFNRYHPWWNLSSSCYNARSNVLTAIWMAHTGGWGPWGG